MSDVRHAAVAGLFYPGKAELHELSEWIARELRVDVPLHFTAFHPDYRLTDRPATPPATLVRARRIAREHGLHDVYTGNVHDLDGDTTYRPQCNAPVIERDWYRILRTQLAGGRCASCHAHIAGRFGDAIGNFGPRRMRVVV